MPTRLTWPGAVAYGAFAIGLVGQDVWMIRQDAYWTGGAVWAPVCQLAAVALTAGLFAVGAITRTPLAGEDEPWLSRRGCVVVVGLTAIAFLAAIAAPGKDLQPFVTGGGLFIPWWVNSLETAYYRGVLEAAGERAQARARAEAETPAAQDDRLT